jgi:hypothetical protein
MVGYAANWKGNFDQVYNMTDHSPVELYIKHCRDMDLLQLVPVGPSYGRNGMLYPVDHQWLKQSHPWVLIFLQASLWVCGT